MIQVIAGYYLLYHWAFFTITGSTILVFGIYSIVHISQDYDLDILFVAVVALSLSFLLHYDRRKSVSNLAANYKHQKELNSRFKQLEENIEQIFILCSSDFNIFYHISSSFDSIMNIDRKTLYLNPRIWMDHIHRGDKMRVELEFDSLSIEKINKEIEFRYLDHEEEKWLKFQIFPVIREGEDSPSRFAIIIHNITESKIAELKLAQSRSLDGELAARIQKNLLFSSTDIDIENVDLEAHSTPSLEVGGDFYDIYPFSESVVDIIIADVMGKGMIASMLGAAAKSAFMKSRLDRTVVDKSIPSVEEIVKEVNGTVSHELIKMGKFITLQYGRLDMEKQIFTFVDKGHTSLIHYSAKHRCSWSLKGWNMPMGFDPEEKEIANIIPFDEGDLFFFYSDGIIEAENDDGEPLGERRLTYILNNSTELTSRQLVYKIRDLVFQYSTYEGFSDDVTSIAMKIGKIPKKNSYRETILRGERDSLQHVRDFTEEYLTEGLQISSEELIQMIVLAINEAFANIVEHSYEKNPRLLGREILFELGKNDEYFYARFFWDGKGFDWTAIESPDLKQMKEGGYGLSLMRNIMDSISYSSNLDDIQQLCMVKKLKTEIKETK